MIPAPPGGYFLLYLLWKMCKQAVFTQLFALMTDNCAKYRGFTQLFIKDGASVSN